MNRVQSIIEHEKAAREPNANAGAHMWAAAREIWEEIQDGKQQKELATEIGKSRTHICWMNKCWEMCGRMPALPDFYDAYYSVEVRGASAGTDYEGRGRDRRPDDIHTWASEVARYASRIADEPAGWPLLDAAERGALRHAVRSIERVLSARKGRSAA
jgi:hypothetical protein